MRKRARGVNVVIVVAVLGGVCAIIPAGVANGAGLDHPAVGVAATPDGKGYWEVASDGGSFTFANAAFEGSEGGQHLNAPVVGMAATPDGRGYWEVASDCGSFTFGNAVPVGPPSVPPSIAFFGDLLGTEVGQDFNSLAEAAGATAFVRAFPATAPCDWLPQMPADVAAFHPSAVVIEFSGSDYTPCMAGYPIGSPEYYAKYQADTQAVIDLFRADGVEVFLVGLPYDASSALNANVANLNQLYASLAAANTGVEYVDAGQAVMADGSFTWTLPCLSGEPCTGPSGTNVVRAPDGVHFCPNGITTQVGYLRVCTVYSSGAF